MGLETGRQITVREASKFLGVSPQTVYLRSEKPDVSTHYTEMGNLLSLDPKDLETFRASFKQEMENA